LKARASTWAVVAAFLVPAFIGVGAVTAIAASPASSASSASSASGAAAQTGDPAHGQTLYGPNCSTCHGSGLGGGIGPPLRPIKNLGDTKDPLDPTYLHDTITNGKSGLAGYATMPPKGGHPELTDQDVNDLIAYIIQQNKIKGPVPLSGEELARSTVTWVTVGVLVMLVLTYLLARYNMRWVARKNTRYRR